MIPPPLSVSFKRINFMPIGDWIKQKEGHVDTSPPPYQGSRALTSMMIFVFILSSASK